MHANDTNSLHFQSTTRRLYPLLNTPVHFYRTLACMHANDTNSLHFQSTTRRLYPLLNTPIHFYRTLACMHANNTKHYIHAKSIYNTNYNNIHRVPLLVHNVHKYITYLCIIIHSQASQLGHKHIIYNTHLNNPSHTHSQHKFIKATSRIS
jgi:hypothetical protein